MNNDKLDLILKGINEINEKLNSINIEEFKNSLNDAKLLVEAHQNSFFSDIAKTIDTKINNSISQIESLMAIYNFLPDLKYLPPSRGWAGSPDFLLKILDIIFKKKPHLIVELGSGLSSVIIGSALKRINQGKLISFDHDEQFFNETKDNVNFNNVESYVNLNYTPLITYENGYKWYDFKKVNIDDKIDLLIVDGPPRIIQQNSRFPALPYLLDKLSEDCIIILDDANRVDEKEIIKKWCDFLDNKRILYTIDNYDFFDKGLTMIAMHKL